MIITFTPLHESHFPLLLKWLESPHVKKWYDSEVNHTQESVIEKYSSYVKGYKLVDRKQKPINAFIINYNQTPVGYIQFYNAYDFPRSKPIIGLPESLGALDIFIGDGDYLRKGIALSALKLFLENYGYPKYRYVLVDPEIKNENAISLYEKAGFKIWKRIDNLFFMIAHKKIVRLSIDDMIALEFCFRKHFLSTDRLWLFGSRADLSKKGGDIDLYIETFAENTNDAYKMKMAFHIEFEEIIGEQKIDIVINMINNPYPLPIHQVALSKGVRII